MRFFSSLLFSTCMILSTIVAALFLMLCAPLPFNFRARVARTYAAFILASLKMLCGVNHQVTGQENIPDEAAIVFSKHQSTWETYALQLLFPPQTWVLKRELMWLPFFGWGLALLKPISINRGAGRKAIKQIIAQGKQRLAKGIWIIIFPEGTRIAPGQHKRWGLGGAILAEHSEAPIVPVAHNAGEFWGRKEFIKKPGTVQVIIGPPIETKGRKAADINQDVETWMNSAMDKINSKPIPVT